MPVSRPSPVVSEVMEDHMTALLAAEAEPAVVERLEHVAVADGRLDHRDPARRPWPDAGRGCVITVTTSVSSRQAAAIAEVERATSP